MATRRPDTSDEDRLLVEHLQAGLSKGLEGIYNRYYSTLVSFAIRFTSDRDAARDVVQEVFFRLWKNREKLAVNTSIKSYLFRAVRNQALNTLRDTKEWASLGAEESILPPAEDMVLSIDNEDAERSRMVKEAVAKLPPKARTIFELSRFEGLTYAEIADYLGIAEKTVENQMRIAMQKLRDWLCVLALMVGAQEAETIFYILFPSAL